MEDCCALARAVHALLDLMGRSDHHAAWWLTVDDSTWHLSGRAAQRP
jgi:hypothetical protein